MINKIKTRISEVATEACGYSPLTKVVSEEEINRILEQESGWIPVDEQISNTDKYILVSFKNFTVLDIGRYETDEDGNGAFYPGDDDKSYVEYGLFVNAWMPLPEPYRVSAENAQPKETPLTEQPQTNADWIRSMTDEELAEWFNTVTKDVLGGSTWNKKGWLKWLQAESEE